LCGRDEGTEKRWAAVQRLREFAKAGARRVDCKDCLGTVRIAEGSQLFLENGGGGIGDVLRRHLDGVFLAP